MWLEGHLASGSWRRGLEEEVPERINSTWLTALWWNCCSSTKPMKAYSINSDENKHLSWSLLLNEACQNSMNMFNYLWRQEQETHFGTSAFLPLGSTVIRGNHVPVCVCVSVCVCVYISVYVRPCVFLERANFDNVCVCHVCPACLPYHTGSCCPSLWASASSTAVS